MDKRLAAVLSTIVSEHLGNCVTAATGARLRAKTYKGLTDPDRYPPSVVSVWKDQLDVTTAELENEDRKIAEAHAALEYLNEVLRW